MAAIPTKAGVQLIGNAQTNTERNLGLVAVGIGSAIGLLGLALQAFQFQRVRNYFDRKDRRQTA